MTKKVEELSNMVEDLNASEFKESVEKYVVVDRLFDASRKLGIEDCRLIFVPKTVERGNLVELYEYLQCVTQCDGDSMTFLWDVDISRDSAWIIGLLPSGADEDTIYGRLRPDYGDVIAAPMIKDGSLYDIYHMTSDECDDIIPKVCCLGRWEMEYAD